MQKYLTAQDLPSSLLTFMSVSHEYSGHELLLAVQPHLISSQNIKSIASTLMASTRHNSSNNNNNNNKKN